MFSLFMRGFSPGTLASSHFLKSECEHAWLCVLCGPVKDLQSAQGVPCLSPNDSWDKLNFYPELE